MTQRKKCLCAAIAFKIECFFLSKKSPKENIQCYFSFSPKESIIFLVHLYSYFLPNYELQKSIELLIGLYSSLSICMHFIARELNQFAELFCFYLSAQLIQRLSWETKKAQIRNKHNTLSARYLKKKLTFCTIHFLTVWAQVTCLKRSQRSYCKYLAQK